MHAMRVALVGTIALAAITSTEQRARAQQASGQYYGYASNQSPAPSGQANYACQPGPSACVPEKYGCTVTVCPCPCQPVPGCIPGIPDIHVPSCQNPCVVINEGPPTTRPVTYDIYRNCYVPIRIDYRPGPSNVTPVNINVKWREVHFLCGPDGQPLSSQQASAVLKDLQEQLASGAVSMPSGAPSAAPSPAAASAPASAAPSLPAPTQAATPQKQWIWLTNTQAYGYGYIGADGYAVIDPGTVRQVLPAETSTSPSPSSGTAIAASAGR